MSISNEDLIDLFFLFSLKLSGSILDVYSGEQGISPVNMGLTSASCPSSLPMKREITGNIAFIVLSFLKINYMSDIYFQAKEDFKNIIKIVS